MRAEIGSHCASRRTVLLTAGGAFAVGATAGCLDGAGSEASPESTTDAVEVAVGPEGDGGPENVFDPGTEEPLEVETGTTVRFVWESNTHNVVVEEQPDGAAWEGHEGVENAGFVHEHTFDVAGEYEIVCEPHLSLGMTATIVVD